MATWGMHFRIAEALSQQLPIRSPLLFCVGNIGADCGMPNEDWSQFTPDSSISHWHNASGQIDAERFYDCQLKQLDKDCPQFDYLLGYYCHLLTDIAFSIFIRAHMRRDGTHRQLKADKSFIWVVKKDWYDLDHRYFRDYPDNIFATVFSNIVHFPELMDYYPEGATIRQIKYISRFYGNPSANASGDLDREYHYMTMTDSTRFVEETVEHLVSQLKPLFKT